MIAGPPVAGVAERAAAARRRSAAPAPAATAATTAGAAASRGEPLLPSVRPRLERVFGVDLGGVRIHTDTEAADMTRQAAAKAMTVGMDIYLAPGERPTDLELLAHEVAHVVQQQRLPAVQLAGGQHDDAAEREAQRAATAAVRDEPVAVQERVSGPRVQRLGLSDVLDYFADKANLIPGYRMFTIILGVNPINMSRVERSAANILRALIEFMPGGGLITKALDNYGVFDKAGAFVDAQVKAVGLSGSAIKHAISEFLDSLGWRDIFRLGSVWTRAKRIFTDPIDKLLTLAKNVVVGILNLVKDAILRPIAKLAEGTRAWDLLIAVLGKNPITGDPVPRNATTLIGGFMKLIGQQEVWSNMQKANAVGRAWTWFQTTIQQLLAFVASIPSMAINAVKSLELMDIVVLPRAFLKVGRVFVTFVGNFISWGLNAVWKLLEIVFDVVSPNAWGYVKKTGAALRSILRNPLPFVGNLARAAKNGFGLFKTNFPEHLKRGLIDWLTGSLPGVYIPKAFSLPEIVKFALSMLGISWANVRAKLVKVIGEPAMKALETTFEIVVILIRDGPAAAWDRIKSELSNLKDTVVEGIIEFVIEAVVKKAIPKFISMFIPGAGFITAIISIYDIVMVFVEKIRKIIQVVTAFVDSIVAIAAGRIDAAAKRVESVLAGFLSLAISFLAGFAGLGKVADKVMGVLNRVRAMIDKGLDRLVEWIVTAAKKVFTTLFGAKDKKPDARTAAQKEADLQRGIAEANTLIANKELSLDEVRAGLGQIKQRYGLSILEVRKESETPSEENDYVYGEVNPTGKTATVKRKLRFVPPAEVTFELSPEHGIAGLAAEFATQVRDQETGLNKLKLENWDKNVQAYADRQAAGGSGRDPRGAKKQEEFREEYRRNRVRQEVAADRTSRTPDQKEAIAEAKVAKEMRGLAALHDPDQIAGGDPTNITRLGSRRINSSLGSQWRVKAPPFIATVRSRVVGIAKKILAKLFMNAKLFAK